MVHENWKLLANRDSSYCELYDLAAGPYETSNLKEQKPKVVRQLLQQIDQWKATLPAKPTGDVFSNERGMTDLFAGNKLNQWTMAKPGAWELTDGVLGVSDTPGGYVWSKKTYENFELSIEYKTSEMCNSGLFFRTDPENAVQRGFEIQIASPEIYDGKHVAGALYDALSPFKDANISLTKIESRPSKKKAWEYYFYVDMEGHVMDDEIAKSLQELELHCEFVKVLGSYAIMTR